MGSWRIKEIKKIVGSIYLIIAGTVVVGFIFASLPSESGGRCFFCGKEIKGKYYLYDNRLFVCSPCHLHLPKCDACGIPTNDFRITGSYRLCLRCVDRLPKCAACRNPILGQMWREEGGQEVFCDDCYRARERCHVCGLPLEIKSFNLPDGRIICSRCRSTAIIHADKARVLLERVSRILKFQYKMEIRHSSELTLVNQKKLIELAGDFTPGEKPFGLFSRQGDRYEFYLLYGLPEALTIAVLAHEYAHAWQAENCPREQSSLIREGFAEWIAYKVLEALRYNREMRQMTQRRDLYGEGLRKFLAMEKEEGREQVFFYVKTAPEGR